MKPHILQFRWAQLMPDRWVCGLATCGRLGYISKAPGTVGSVVGLVLYTIFFHSVPVFSQVMALLLLSWFAIGICGEAEVRLQKRDPGEIILDEVIAVPMCFIGIHYWSVQTGHLWAYMIVGFLLFRVFDILKPFGINSLQSYPRGIGVVADDIGAAFVTLVLLHLFGYGWVHYFI